MQLPNDPLLSVVRLGAVKVVNAVHPLNADEPIVPIVLPSVTDNKGVLFKNALFGITVVSVELILRFLFPLVVPNALASNLRSDIAVKPVGKLRTKLLLQPENAFALTCTAVLFKVTVANALHPLNADEPISVTVLPSVTDNKGVLLKNALFGITIGSVELIIRVVFPPVVPNALASNLRPDIAVKPVGKLSVNELLQPENAFASTVVKDVLLIVTVANAVQS